MLYRRYIVQLKKAHFPIFLSGGLMKSFIPPLAVVLLFACLLFSSCKTMQFPTGKGYTELCQTYVGAESSNLVDSWGPPGRTFDVPNGKEIFVYVETIDEYAMNPLAHSALIEYPPIIDRRRSGPGEATATVVGQSVPAMDYCITYFEVGKRGNVKKVFWKGDCKSLEKTKAK